MLDFNELNRKIPMPDKTAERESKTRWDSIAKPLDGLGYLEDMVVKIAALTGKTDVHIDKRAVVVLCADNGVVAEGVTQTDSSVTAIMAEQIHNRRSSVCLMAAAAKTDVFAVDMGMLTRVENVDGCHIADGTENIAIKAAMTKEQACEAIAYGIDLVRSYAEKGYQLIATGEMGIGNTTSSSAVAAILLDLPVETVTGRGAGLSDEALERKCRVIHRAIEINKPDRNNRLDVLAKLGGFDIAGMVGMFIGGAIYRVPVIIDGLISSVSALIASRLCPDSRIAMLASHTSAEPAAEMILRELGLNAVIRAGMKLGEGTGAVCLMPILDMALMVYHNSATFKNTDIEQYQPLGGKKE